MTRLPEPRYELRARARTLSVRAQAIASYADHLAALDPDQDLTPEDVQVMISAFDTLAGELQAEQAGLIQKLGYC